MLKREGEIRIPSGCAISGIIDKKGARFSGSDIIKSIALMHDRSNGLGGGFAGYGIYPQYKDFFALHIFYDSEAVKHKTEDFLNNHFEIESAGNIPTRKVSNIVNKPLIWRYFVQPRIYKVRDLHMDEKEFTARCVIRINREFAGAYVFSSGKNMGAFKGVGYPEDIGDFFMLENYEGYIWTAHGRFPTNTPGWWGGAHPFTMLDWSIVHNGEISSYDANRRFVEMYGYNCSLQTDTEVITYLLDLLVRKHNLPLEKALQVLVAPFWNEIERETPEKAKELKALRTVYASALINGPFSILVGYQDGLIALNDRIKLRSMVMAEKGNKTFFASEESAIKIICPNPENVYHPKGGEAIVVKLEAKK